MMNMWYLNHDGRVGVPSGLEDSVDGGGRGAVEGRESHFVVTAVLQQLHQVGASHHAGGDNSLQAGHLEWSGVMLKKLKSYQDNMLARYSQNYFDVVTNHRIKT